eukprot:jgi/Mesvir1/10856/Mv08177-RA.1
MATGNNDEVGGWEGPREIDEKAEARALAKVVRAYRAYASDAHEAVTRWEAHYSRLPDADKALVPELPVKYAHIRQCIASNAYFIHCMLSATAQNGRDHALIGGASATHEHCSGAGCGVPHPKRKKSVLDPDEGARGILTVVSAVTDDSGSCGCG